MASPFTVPVAIPANWTNDNDLAHFTEICRRNPEKRVERTADGELLIMPPTGGETGHRNLEITGQLRNWSRQDKTGLAFDSNTAFQLPNRAIRSPDASWITRERWNALSAAERDTFPPLCPDFVIELRSPSDRIEELQEKMNEWITNGARLAWLIDPKSETAWIHRPGREVETLSGFDRELSGENILPEFRLDLRELR